MSKINSGNVVGYHVTQPCDTCMGACNNGHFWMFHSDAVEARDRMEQNGIKSHYLLLLVFGCNLIDP